MATRNPDAVALTWAMRSPLLREAALAVMASAIRKTRGEVKASGDLLGVDPRILYRAVEEYPSLRATLELAKRTRPPSPAKPARKPAKKSSGSTR